MAGSVRNWLRRLGVPALYIESFKARQRLRRGGTGNGVSRNDGGSRNNSKSSNSNAKSRGWHKARRIQPYFATLEDEIVRRHGVIAPGSEADRRLKWVHAYANQFDPLVPAGPEIGCRPVGAPSIRAFCGE